MAVSKLKKMLRSAGESTPVDQSIGGWLERYTIYLRSECHLADNTVAAYNRDLQRLKDWLDGRSPAKLGIQELSQFVGYLKSEKLAPSSISRHIVSVRMFYKYLQLEGAVKDNPAELLATQKMWQRVPKVMTQSAVERFLTAPQKQDALWIRDRAILELMYATGCRVSEVANMLRVNVHLEDGYCLAEGKGSKQRMVPLGKQAIEVIRTYLEESRPTLCRGKDLSTCPWVIVSRTGRRLRREAIWELVKRYAIRACIDPNITPHTLRHSLRLICSPAEPTCE